MKSTMMKLFPFLLLAILVSCVDPNESGIVDCKDFKDVEVIHSAPNLETDITFYDTMCLNEFFYYFNTDSDPAADFLIRCRPTEFTISKESATSPGLYDDLKYTGTPSVSGVHYRLQFPLTVLEAMPTVAPITIGYWFYAMDEKDRMPDSGEKTITLP